MSAGCLLLSEPRPSLGVDEEAMERRGQGKFLFQVKSSQVKSKKHEEHSRQDKTDHTFMQKHRWKL